MATGRRFAVAILMVLPTPAAASPAAPVTVKSFFNDAYRENEKALARYFALGYRAALDLGMPDTPSNHAAFLQSMFVYALVRTDGVLRNAFIIREEDGRHPDRMLRDAF